MIHVGSNNIDIHQSVNQIISFYRDLIHYIKCKTSAQIIFTSILRRLCDFHQTERMPVPSQGHYGFHSFPVVD
jgi:hypothetical protein